MLLTNTPVQRVRVLQLHVVQVLVQPFCFNLINHCWQHSNKQHRCIYVTVPHDQKIMCCFAIYLVLQYQVCASHTAVAKQRLPRTVRVNTGSNHFAACGVLEHDRAVVTFQRQRTLLSSHTPITLVLHNFPFLFSFAVTLLLVYGVIAFQVLHLALKLLSFFFPHLGQLALREVKMLAVFISLKYSIHQGILIFYRVGLKQKKIYFFSHFRSCDFHIQKNSFLTLGETSDISHIFLVNLT